MMSERELLERAVSASTLALLLDYDGTLAEFAPTPDHIEPNDELIEILDRLAASPRVRVAIVSGRSLAAVEALVPVEGLTIAGSYGAELRRPGGRREDRLSLPTLRPFLERLAPQWSGLIEGQEGFFLEDKRWSLALHGRFAAEEVAGRVFPAAREAAERLGIPAEFRLLDGDRFLELAPRAANKGDTVEYLLARPGLPAAGLPLYLGDDLRDLEAFAVVHRHGGLTAHVGVRHPEAAAAADCRFAGPAAVRAWLRLLLSRVV